MDLVLKHSGIGILLYSSDLIALITHVLGKISLKVKGTVGRIKSMILSCKASKIYMVYACGLLPP